MPCLRNRDFRLCPRFGIPPTSPISTDTLIVHWISDAFYGTVSPSYVLQIFSSLATFLIAFWFVYIPMLLPMYVYVAQICAWMNNQQCITCCRCQDNFSVGIYVYVAQVLPFWREWVISTYLNFRIADVRIIFQTYLCPFTGYVGIYCHAFLILFLGTNFNLSRETPHANDMIYAFNVARGVGNLVYSTLVDPRWVGTATAAHVPVTSPSVNQSPVEERAAAATLVHSPISK